MNIDIFFIYSDNCILESKNKLILFKQSEFDGESEKQYIEKYRNEYRQRYVQDYESLELNIINSQKRQHEKSSDDDDDDDDSLHYRFFLYQQVQSFIIENEFDQYLLTSSSDKKIKTLNY